MKAPERDLLAVLGLLSLEPTSARGLYALAAKRRLPIKSVTAVRAALTEAVRFHWAERHGPVPYHYTLTAAGEARLEGVPAVSGESMPSEEPRKAPAFPAQKTLRLQTMAKDGEGITLITVAAEDGTSFSIYPDKNGTSIVVTVWADHSTPGKLVVEPSTPSVVTLSLKK